MGVGGRWSAVLICCLNILVPEIIGIRFCDVTRLNILLRTVSPALVDHYFRRYVVYKIIWSVFSFINHEKCY